MEEEGTRQSKLFMILAIALIGLLVLGLLGIGGVFVIRQNLQEQAALAQATPTLLIRLPNPITPTSTPVKAQATDIPAPTPTNTPVVVPGSDGAQASAGNTGDQSDNSQAQAKPTPTPTRTPVVGASTAATPNEVPNTGLGGLEAVLIAIGLAGVLFVVRRMRMSA